ncbi:uncharacterized protein N7459_000029 [Penicillium hispanicum]|uniref:uncharacterized protein n=1 Tax=Penicillium hispanicum TaxID=1080232 RepID=UPI00254043E6|nr:uncharacterized protein N7459_000029 [Penicillium hispanicum]KAJ5593821.1 hypothetical protein N7459_000029 [Penicillium hispanicum]
MGAPPSVDLPPRSNGHAHGHSRSRGHNRSTRWTQPPSPLSLGSNPIEPRPSELTDPVDANDPSSEVPQSQQPWSHDHYHHYTHAASHSNAQHDHSHTSHLLDHDHELQSTPAVQAENSVQKIHEILSGALITLPWIVLSWYPRRCAQKCQISQDGSSVGVIGQVGQKTCVLTAMTLLIFACSQLLRVNPQGGGTMPISSVKFPAPNVKTLQAALLQAFSIGLPIYASLKIGGFLVAFALLLATATGVPSLVDTDPRTAATERYRQKTLTIVLLAGVTLLSFLGLNQPWDASPVSGYLALLLSVFVLSPPFPSFRRLGPIPEPGLVAASISEESKGAGTSQSSVFVTTDASLALICGASLAVLSILTSGGLPFGTSDLFFLLLPAGLFAIALMVSFPAGLRSPNKLGLAICTGTAALLCSPHIRDDFLFVYAVRGILAAISFYSSKMDDSHLRLDSHSHSHSHHHGHSHVAVESSRITKWLLQRSEPYPLLYSILKEKDSRSIFYFMCLNFAFMLVQLSYGFLTGSLGLLSDSIHMFFDCLALVVGLCAAVMSKWPPNARFPYGYGKVDTLSGFANGIFLMIISVEIIYEAVERLSSGSQMNRIGELLAVSIAGLLVNLVGIFSFEHGHHHHGHDHGHDHSHGNENMHGIFLHILADTLGSVAVVISTILVHYSGWSGYDPLASCFIAILIFASAVPLVSSTAKTLLLALPADTEYNVRETLAGVSTLRGVVGYTVPKFWLDDTGSIHPHAHMSQKVLGVIHVVASHGSDLEDIRQRTVNYLRDKDMDIVVQVERDGDGRCWCGGGNKGP